MTYRLISIIDTRDILEDNDKIYRIPGTGDKNECNRCGKLHEIHCEIDFDGDMINVGKGCAKKLCSSLGRQISVYDAKKQIKILKESLPLKMGYTLQDYGTFSSEYSISLQRKDGSRFQFKFLHVNKYDLFESVMKSKFILMDDRGPANESLKINAKIRRLENKITKLSINLY